MDVFFVISGYLITGIIRGQLESGQFRFADFYERRARRILPALLVMLAASAVAGWFLLDPFLFERLGQGVMAVIAFGSNILYWRTTNYFTAGLENPLLHTWSLGVEEQFYVIFPIALWLAWRFIPRRILWLILLFSAASLVAAQINVHKGRALAAFYLLPTRACELLIGAALAFSDLQRRLAPFPLLRHCLAWAGIFGIGAGVAIYDATTPFPGLSVLLPALGAAAVLAGASRDNALGRVLASRPLVGIGLISYSAYLWHQPLFTYAHTLGAAHGTLTGASLTLLSLAIAWLSWRYIETPFRAHGRIPRRTALAILGTACAVMFAVGAAICLTQGAALRFSEEQRRWWAYGNVELQSKYVVGRFNALETDFGPEPGPKVLVVGDSQAQDFLNVALEGGAWHGHQVRTFYISPVCQPVWDRRAVESDIAPADRGFCRSAKNLKQSLGLIEQADIVVIAANWQLWSAAQLPATLERLSLRPGQQLVIVGPKRFAVPEVIKLARMQPAERASLHYSLEAERLRVNERVRDMTAGRGVYIDLIDRLCPEARCPVFTPDDRLISYDGGHFTRDGAQYAASVLSQGETLRQLLDARPRSSAPEK
ncbi:hypothetical protein AW878_14190 [Bordetella pseudohinzii]|uniref:O-acetyltransferase OatA n=1 Tax=Bordetella pseudohinzii TaxID=1331258 RepID=A0A0M7HW93_9BORD|nr:hypothetical protein BBN53_21015 [Bordetella pseudohinzii]KXA77842.1 hypothetical protein AW878_14190 [Bordetella pseudohinzii]KXA78038.1 hypothetical protein AW877_12650 [Bordetella pseudohinzii]CUJ13822.1 O-acetyltransferase OatA [Bordetella pseudohinzii]